MQAIRRGSIYLTDDFIQSMLTSRGTLTGFICLNLPQWHNDGLNINAVDLGMTAGQTNANVLMPESFLRYWFNLCAHSRQFHASLQQGLQVEDFAEQAFWKMLIRFINQGTTTTPNPAGQALFASLMNGDFAVYKSNDVIVNSNTVDGNMYLEALLSIPQNAKRHNCMMRLAKPNYLSTVQNLPLTQQNNILGGHVKALYDWNTNTYTLSQDECLRIAVNQETDEDSFVYNAILLMYSIETANGTIEQCAGIYFPDKWQQVAENDGDIVFELPSIVKANDVSLGYSVNIALQQNGDYTFSADNAELNTAHQLYTSLYRNFLQLNYQTEALINTVQAQQNEISQWKALFTDGYFARLELNQRDLAEKLATRFSGSVSSSRLLDLFLQAKNNEGRIINPTFQLTDLSQAVISRDILVSDDIGAYRQKDIVPMGTSITEIISNILSNKVPPVYVQPTVQLLLSSELDRVIYVPYGANLTAADAVQLTQTIDDGDSGGHEIYALTEDNGGVLASLPTDLPAYTNDNVVNDVRLILQVAFSAGPVKNYSDGSPAFSGAINAGIQTAVARIVPTFNAYFGGISLLEQLPTINPAQMQAIPIQNLKTILSSGFPMQVLLLPDAYNNPVIEQPTSVLNVGYIVPGVNISYKAYAYNASRINLVKQVLEDMVEANMNQDIRTFTGIRQFLNVINTPPFTGIDEQTVTASVNVGDMAYNINFNDISLSSDNRPGDLQGFATLFNATTDTITITGNYRNVRQIRLRCGTDTVGKGFVITIGTSVQRTIMLNGIENSVINLSGANTGNITIRPLGNYDIQLWDIQFDAIRDSSITV